MKPAPLTPSPHLACQIKVFDCTRNGRNWKIPERIRSRVELIETCLGETDGVVDGKHFGSWDGILRAAGISSAPAWLKLDCEGCERTVLPQMLAKVCRMHKPTRVQPNTQSINVPIALLMMRWL